jgi:beta-lactamase class A
MTASQPSTLSLLERRLRMLTQGVVAEWGVYVRFLDNGDEIAINADVMMDTMSLIKVPLLVSLMRRVDRGEVDLGRRITLAEDQKRLGTGILRYFEAGANFSLRDAAWVMEAVSDNSATDICLEAAGGADAVNATMRELGMEGIRMMGTALDWFRALGGSMAPELATMSPGEFARRGYPPLSTEGMADARARYHFETGRPFSLGTPRAFGELLSRIEAKTCASAASCDFILEILSAQQLRDFMPRYVWGAAFAHKTGNFPPYISSDIGVATPVRGSKVIICLLSQRHNGARGVIEDCLGRMTELVVLEAEGR